MLALLISYNRTDYGPQVNLQLIPPSIPFRSWSDKTSRSQAKDIGAKSSEPVDVSVVQVDEGEEK